MGIANKSFYQEEFVPLYDYGCSICGHQFERREGFDADPVTPCPECQGQARRLFHSVPIIYKGSGFYTTDYKRKNYSPPDNSSDTATADKAPSTDTATADKAPSTDTATADKAPSTSKSETPPKEAKPKDG